jgi:hypothetical protein
VGVEVKIQMNDDRPKRDSMSIEEATVSTMWEITAIVELLEQKGLCTKQDLHAIIGKKYKCQEPFPEWTVASCGARMDRPARALSGNLMHHVLSHAYMRVPIMAPDTFYCPEVDLESGAKPGANREVNNANRCARREHDSPPIPLTSSRPERLLSPERVS